MLSKRIARGVYWVGAIDWDRRLFDELIPLPDGTSYNAYLVEGNKKIALIDTVDSTKTQILLDSLDKAGVRHIDYIVANHAEQDHSGSIPEILETYREAKVIATSRCKEMLKKFLLISEERFITVRDGETISLGDRVLEFIHASWVHWPETMLTYLRDQRILFTCDLFGSHYATDSLFIEDEREVYEAAKRYYAEIMMPFRKIIHKHLRRIKDLDIEVIAPSHGPLYRKPTFIIEAYEDWISDDVKNEVVITYVSMHGSTAEIISHLVDALVRRGVRGRPFNITVTDVGDLAMRLVDAATLVVASLMVLGGPHPGVIYTAHLINALRPKLRFVSMVISYGWGGRAVKVLKEILSNLMVEIIEPILVQGKPKKRDLERVEQLAEEIFYRHKEVGIIKEE